MVISYLSLSHPIAMVLLPIPCIHTHMDTVRVRYESAMNPAALSSVSNIGGGYLVIDVVVVVSLV